MFYMAVGVHIVDFRAETPCRYQIAYVTQPHHHHTNSDPEGEGGVTSEMLLTSLGRWDRRFESHLRQGCLVYAFILIVVSCV
jgi:hypothetical protein